MEGKMNIEKFIWDDWDPDVSYSAGIAPIILGASPKVLLIRQEEGTIRTQKGGETYREQAWWKVPFGKEDVEDSDPENIALREGLEETGCFFQKEDLVSVVHKRILSRRPGHQTYHEDYFFLGLFDKELAPIQNITDKRVCGACYFPLDYLPITGKEPGALGTRIAQKHLWGIYSLCMEHRNLEEQIYRYGNQLRL